MLLTRFQWIWTAVAYTVLTQFFLFSHEASFDTPILTVKGTATIAKPADELRINIGVVSQGSDAQDALNENSQKMRKISKALEGIGLRSDEYQTSRFSIRPLYSERPKNASPNDWSRKIIAYEVMHSLLIKTGNIDKAGELIDQAAENGANTIDSINFALSNPQQYRFEVISTATENALKDAKALSSAANVKLVRIQSLTLDDARLDVPLPRGQLYTKAFGAESVPIVGGNVEIQATITIQFEID